MVVGTVLARLAVGGVDGVILRGATQTERRQRASPPRRAGDGTSGAREHAGFAGVSAQAFAGRPADGRAARDRPWRGRGNGTQRADQQAGRRGVSCAAGGRPAAGPRGLEIVESAERVTVSEPLTRMRRAIAEHMTRSLADGGALHDGDRGRHVGDRPGATGGGAGPAAVRGALRGGEPVRVRGDERDARGRRADPARERQPGDRGLAGRATG